MDFEEELKLATEPEMELGFQTQLTWTPTMLRKALCLLMSFVIVVGGFVSAAGFVLAQKDDRARFAFGNVTGGNVTGGNVTGGNVTGGNVTGGNVTGGNIAVDETKRVYVRRNAITYLQFTPEVSGVYEFYSTGSEDTLGYLFDADKNRIKRDDDSGNGENFFVYAHLYAGVTYYWGASFCDSSKSGSFDVTLVCASVDADPIPDGEIYAGEVKYIQVSDYNTTYLKFIPEVSGNYSFYSMTYGDTYGYLCDADKNIIRESDDGGSFFNFSISYDLEAGETYYWGARYYDNLLGGFNVALFCNYTADGSMAGGKLPSEADFSYVVEDEKAKIVRYEGRTENAVIPATLGGYPVTTIGNSAFFGSEVVSITIPVSVTTIEDWAFNGCDMLAYVYYGGTPDQRGQMNIGDLNNGYLLMAEWYYNSCVGSAAHTYTDDCDESCDVCGATRTVGDHQYTDACDKSCNICGDTRTAPHAYAAATCTKPKTCKLCGATSGKKLGHTYTNACDTSCNTCGVTRTITHDYAAATCTKAKTCKVCGVTNGIAAGHKYTNSCDKTCNVCKFKRTTVKHTYTNACDTTCNVCKAKRTIKHTYAAATCTKAKTCTICGATSGKSLGHTYTNKCDASCNRCKATRTIKHSYKTVTTKATLTKDGRVDKKCTVCGNVMGTRAIKRVKTCKLSTTSYTYDGKVKSPGVTVKDSTGKTLRRGVDYTVSYAGGRKAIGTYKVTVKMIGKYSGTKTLSFKIKPIKISKCKLKLSATAYSYNGKVKTPSVTVKSPTGKTLKKGIDYTVSYASGRKHVGTYKVTVKMKGKYTGSKTLTFKINPPKTTVSKLTAGKKSLTVSITKKTKQVSGYQIQYATSKSFKNATTKTVSSYKTTKLTLKSLKADKTYYVRVRTYKTVNGKKVYSDWSAAKSVKTKK